MPAITSLSSSIYSLILARLTECYFCDHLVKLELLFLDYIGLHLAMVEQTFRSVSESEEDIQGCLSLLHLTLNATSHLNRNCLLRLTADSPDLFGIILKERMA